MLIEEIKQLTKATQITGTYVITKCELKPFAQKTGNFMQCLLTDRTGTIKGIIWDHADNIATRIKNRMAVIVKGESTRYNDTPQVVISSVTEATEYDLALLVPSLERSKIDSMHKELLEIGKTIDNPTCKKAWNFVVSEDQSHCCGKSFKECPGGVGTVHHAYIGGLMEHAFSMVRIAERFAKEKKLDRDVLITGCLIHDVGKILSYNWKKTIEMTDDGRLLHHTTLGYGLLLDHLVKVNMGSPMASDVLKLLHIVISHHEDEGLVKPMFPEALAVSQVDALDAMINHATDYMDKPENQVEDSNWTKFCQLTERQYYKPRAAVEVEGGVEIV